jgi:glutathione S-transferase
VLQLIGMLDSPYVRRVAISLRLLGLPFEHRSISVFRQYDEFAAINPVVKAPSLVCDDGEVLMDSGLILDYAERLAAPRASLLPKDGRAAQHDLRLTGLALAGCEKAVQIVYETTLRPVEKQHAAWLERVRGQLGAALATLEAELVRTPLAAGRDTITQAGITVAVVWGFTQSMMSEVVAASTHPALVAHAAAAEALPEFLDLPPRGGGRDGILRARGMLGPRR